MNRRGNCPTCDLSYPISITFWTILSNSSLDTDSDIEADVSVASDVDCSSTRGCSTVIGDLYEKYQLKMHS